MNTPGNSYTHHNQHRCILTVLLASETPWRILSRTIFIMHITLGWQMLASPSQPLSLFFLRVQKWNLTGLVEQQKDSLPHEISNQQGELHREGLDAACRCVVPPSWCRPLCRLMERKAPSTCSQLCMTFWAHNLYVCYSKCLKSLLSLEKKILYERKPSQTQRQCSNTQESSTFSSPAFPGPRKPSSSQKIN